MKKFWKFSVCALAATFTLSSVTACGDKGETEEKSNITADQVLAIGDALTESLSGVRSFNLGWSLEMGETIPGASMSTSIETAALVNITASGVDLKLAATMEDKSSVQDMPDYSYNKSQSLSAYIIDGFAYTQDEEDATGMTYIKSPSAWENLLDDIFQGEYEMDLSDVLESILSAEGEIAMPDIPVDLIKEILNDEFTLIQKGDTTRVTLDLKQEFNEFFAYLGNLSTNTKIGDMINFTLKYIDEDLTWQDFAGLLKGKGGYTVGTVINVVDNELYNAADVHLQDVKDMIFAEPSVYEALVEELGKEAADELVNTTVEQVVAQYGTMTFDDIIKAVSEDETATLDGVITGIETTFSSVTLGDVMDVENAAVLNQITATFKGVRADDLNANLIFTVKDDVVTRVEVSCNVKISVSAQGENITIYMNYSAYAENFNQAMQTIVLPMGSTVNIYCDDCGLTATEGDYCAGCQAYRHGNCHDQNEHNG